MITLIIFFGLASCNNENNNKDMRDLSKKNENKIVLRYFIENKEKLLLFCSFKREGNMFNAGVIYFNESDFEIKPAGAGPKPQLINIKMYDEYVEFIERYKWIGAKVITEDSTFFSYYFFIKVTANDLQNELKKNKDIYPVKINVEDLNPEEINKYLINSKAAKLCETSKATKIYNKPMFNSEVISELSEGENIEVISVSEKQLTKDRTTDYFYKVKTKDGKEGWVFGYYVDFPQSVKVNTKIEE